MVVGKFAINGTDYVVVKMESATHVMPEMDWKRFMVNYILKNGIENNLKVI